MNKKGLMTISVNIFFLILLVLIFIGFTMLFAVTQKHGTKTIRDTGKLISWSSEILDFLNTQVEVDNKKVTIADLMALADLDESKYLLHLMCNLNYSISKNQQYFSKAYINSKKIFDLHLERYSTSCQVHDSFETQIPSFKGKLELLIQVEDCGSKFLEDYGYETILEELKYQVPESEFDQRAFIDEYSEYKEKREEKIAILEEEIKIMESSGVTIDQNCETLERKRLKLRLLKEIKGPRLIEAPEWSAEEEEVFEKIVEERKDIIEDSNIWIYDWERDDGGWISMRREGTIEVTEIGLRSELEDNNLLKAWKDEEGWHIPSKMQNE